MPQDPNKIHIGAARIWLNVTQPATAPTADAEPTYLPIDSLGQPTSGTEVGYTEGAATFTYKTTKQEVEAEQSLNPVDVFITKEECMLEFNAMEHVYNTMKTAFDSVNSANDASKMSFWAGDASGLVSVNTQCIALTSRIRTATGKFEVLCVYRVYNVEGIVIPYARTSVAVYKMNLKALVDSTRTVGDRLFQWRREKPATGISPSSSTSPSASASSSVSPSKSPSSSVSPS